MNIQQEYSSKKSEIQKRLKQFKELPEKKYFSEFLFCLLTPQSNAQKCWQAVEELSELSTFTEKKVEEILRPKTRFYKTKTKYILSAPYLWRKEIKSKIRADDPDWSRHWLIEVVKGMGMKESSHFLRNIGFSNNKIAILDRHILKNLEKNKIIENAKIKSKKDYLEIEQKFLNFAKSINIPIDELDLLWWSQENGKIFK